MSSRPVSKLAACLALILAFAAPLVGAEPIARLLAQPKAGAESVLIAFDDALFDRVLKSSGETAVVLPLEDGTLREAVLFPRSTPLFTPGAVVILQDGTRAERRPVPKVDSLLGHLVGEPGSSITMNRINGRIYGTITPGEGPTVAISPAGKGHPKGAHQITADGGDLSTPGSFCHLMPVQGREPAKEPVGPEKQVAELTPIEVAVDSDYEVYRFLGYDAEISIDYTAQLMAAVAAIYERDLAATFQVTAIRQWTSHRDPYRGEASQTILGQSNFMLLANQYPPEFANADHIHVLGRIGNRGGVAYLDTMSFCGVPAREFRLGFSDIFATAEFPISSFVWDAYVVAHEIGHSSGSPHTHCYNPPIDQCYGVEPGCYSGPSVPVVGTIMSYCHLVSTVRLEFSPREIALIRGRLSAVGCLPGRVTVEPNPPVAGAPVTVRYEPAGGPLQGLPGMQLGRGFNDWTNGQAFADAMTVSGSGWEATYTVPAQAYSIVHYLRAPFESDFVYDNNDWNDWRFAVSNGVDPVPLLQSDRVTISPDPPQRGRPVSIRFNAIPGVLVGAAAMNIHRGVNGWDEILSPLPMTRLDGDEWVVQWPVGETVNSIEFVFNNTQDIWDNNMGEDWHFLTVEAPPISFEGWMLH